MRSVLTITMLLLLFSCKQSVAQKESAKHLFFLHNAFLESHDINDEHSEYGRVEYDEVITKFSDNGFTVISEQRSLGTDVVKYARQVADQIDSLLQRGVIASDITVVGTSKGGYIAQYVSSIAANPDLNFVFVGCFRESDIQNFPDINWCGNILNIYEKSDPAGNPASSRKTSSTCSIENFKDLEINTGLRHGFLFKALEDWMQPAMDWASNNGQE